ncbi:MAG: glycosyltransferase family 4 protein [archaeon]
MKKIIIIWNGMTSKQISGGDVHIINLVKELSKNNEVSIILPKVGEKLINFSNKNLKLIKIKDKYSIDKKSDLVKTYFNRAKKTSKILKKERFDIVISANPFFCDILPLKSIKQNVKIVSYVLHVLPIRKSSNFNEKFLNLLAKIQERICFNIIRKKANLILTCNSIEREKIMEKIKGVRVEIAGIGINAKKIDKLNVKRKKNTAVFVGRIVKQKGIFDLLKIMEEINGKNKKFKLNIIGGGPEKERLIYEIKKKGMQKNVFVLGYIENENDIYKKLKESEFFLFPSYEEGFGIVIADALYAGCKVICYELEHYYELFKDFPEYVKLGDIKAFASKLNIKRNLKLQKKFMINYDYALKIKKDAELVVA